MHYSEELLVLSKSECAHEEDIDLYITPMTVDLIPFETFRFAMNTCDKWVYEMAVVHNGRVSWFEDTFQPDYTMPGGLYQFQMSAFSRKTGQRFYQNMSYQVLIPVNDLKINKSFDIHTDPSGTFFHSVGGGEAILCSGKGYPKPSFYWDELLTDDKGLTDKAIKCIAILNYKPLLTTCI